MSDADAGAHRTPMSYDEYRRVERASETKHEFADSEMFAMAGAKRAHNVAAANVIGELRNALRTTPCQVYTSDMRVRTANDVGAYPDVSVACAEPRFTDEFEDELLNPVLIVEVLSDSTEAYDRGKKFEHYQTVDSLREYVLVDPRRVHVDVFTRERDGWMLRSFGQGGEIRLPSVDVVVRMDEIYAKVLAAAAE